MARYQDSYPSTGYENAWEDEYADDRGTADRALVPYDGDDDWDEDDEDEFLAARPGVTIIPGAGLATRLTVQRRRRPLTMHVVVGVVLTCILATTLITFNPLGSSGTEVFSAFGTLSQAAVVNRQEFISYRARSGDTLESIAATFGVKVGGIQYLNNMTAVDEVQFGQVYKIPTNATFGQTYRAPLPLGFNEAGGGLTDKNYYAKSNPEVAALTYCMFCSHGGRLNDNGAANCAPGYQLGGVKDSYMTSGDLASYNLVPPDPGAHWVRGFTYFHDGVDISTGTDGTPLVAAQAGQVIFAGPDRYGSGNAVKINHCGGLATSYSHMNGIAVRVGDYVTAGQPIGTQGNTGQSFGAHLHMILWWANVPIDPLCGYRTTPVATNIGWSAGYYGGCPPAIYKTAWNP